MRLLRDPQTKRRFLLLSRELCKRRKRPGLQGPDRFLEFFSLFLSALPVLYYFYLIIGWNIMGTAVPIPRLQQFFLKLIT